MEKEQRRRKIISRGTDRMALITGRINALDQDPISKCSSFTVARHDLPPQHVRAASEPLDPHQEALFQYDHLQGGHDASEMVMKPLPIEEGSNDPNPEQKEKATTASDNAQCSSRRGNAITAKEINFSILSTEDMRAICSAALGALVVLAHVLQEHVMRPKGIIEYGPLYVLLMSDFLIVAARLVTCTQMRREDRECRVEGDDLNLGGAFKYLELGLVLHQSIRALFADCCFYLAVIVLGLSLV